MNELALAGVKDVLNKLSQNDLFGLTATITQGLFKPKETSREEAVEVILKYSPDPLTILKRRVITREVLFTYLWDRSITVELPTTKEKLIIKISELWNLTPNKDERLQPLNPIGTNQQTPTHTDSNINIMAKQFSEWFYEMLNKPEHIDADHFYPDAQLKLNIISDSSTVTDQTENPTSIVELLFKTKTGYNLFFNPNLSGEGVQGRVDPHGLVMVLTCGTLHSNDICVGLFEQVFALARDPFCENNWKIKNTELNLRSKSGGVNVNTPSLSNNELTSKLLSLPSR